MLLSLVLSILGFVPQAECDRVAEQMIEIYHPGAELSATHVFSNTLGEPHAYAYVYEVSSLDPSRQYDDHDERWGIDRYVTVYVGADYSLPPVLEVARCLPASEVNRDQAIDRAQELWDNPRLSGYVYLAPLDEFFEFTTDDGTKHLHSRLLVEYDLAQLVPANQSGFLAYAQHPGWQRPVSTGLFLAKEAKIEGVPYALWSYGCSPTASSMILDYWDRHGYPRLVDFYFDRWDNVEQEEDHDLTNCHRELAVAMHTDSMYRGGTSVGAINGGNLHVTNVDHNYSFSGSHRSGSNAYVYGVVIDEIDEERPVHWSVGNYDYHGNRIYHSVTAIGYEITTGNDSFVVIHNTWDRAEHRWIYRTPGSYSDAYPLIPGGEQDENLRLTLFDVASIVYRNLNYALTWDREGSFSQFKVWRADDDKHNHWALVTTAEGDADYAVFTLTDDFTGMRINVEGFQGGSLIAADGTPKRLIALDFPGNAHFTPVGHVPAQGYPAEKILDKGDILYVIKGGTGVSVLEVYDDYLVPLVLLDAHAASDISIDGDWLYVLGDDKLTLYDISEPSSPQLSDTRELSDDYSHIASAEGMIYMGGVGPELSSLRRTGGQIIEESSVPETLVTGLTALSNRLYVSCHIGGVNIYDITNPLTPQFERNVPTTGAAGAVTRSGSVLYVAEGNKGVESIDLSSGVTSIYDPGKVFDMKVAGDKVFVAAGQNGLFVCEQNGSGSLTQLTQLDLTAGAVEGIALGDAIYLGAGFDGVLVLESDLAGAAESSQSTPRVSVEFPGILNRTGSPGYIELTQPTQIKLLVFDVTGRRIANSTHSFEAGRHQLSSLPADLSSGVYFVKVETGTLTFNGKVLLIE